jgi:hypothetical protein
MKTSFGDLWKVIHPHCCAFNKSYQHFFGVGRFRGKKSKDVCPRLFFLSFLSFSHWHGVGGVSHNLADPD